MASPLPTFETQADACLQEAAALRSQLIRYGRKLTNNDEEAAHELVQEATLRLHDSVQGRGLPSGPIKATLFVIMRNQHHALWREKGRWSSLDAGQHEEGEAEEYQHPALRQLEEERLSDEVDAHQTQALAAAATVALRGGFPLAERVLFRLSADGYTTRDIEGLTGCPKSSVARTLDRMRTSLQLLLRPLVGRA